MNQEASATSEPQAAAESRLAGYLRSVWPANLSPAARSNLRVLYTGIAGEQDNATLPSPHAQIPEAWLERDQSGTLVGVGGLSRSATPHALRLGRRRLYAWCAFDCLFLPEVLEATLEVCSLCPQSGREITLRVSAETIERISPADAVISFVTPEAATVVHGLRQVFCRHVRFFQSAEAARTVIAGDVSILTPAMAHRLGRIRNRIVFGDASGARSRQSSR